MMTYLPELAIIDGECELCKTQFYVLANPGDLPEAQYCPFCGKDGYGCKANEPMDPKPPHMPCGDPNCPAADWGCT